eukprot:TRINITY_DN14933_c0_g1_i1.p1 TRINITY_DN14933_c0_g1~~TRINITY_DN14933_c0_g1_i1.p1  ORF type:complete len:662 (-),score=63.05 TRINITY_DN14933_c0_g1_i1:176-2065(-)
MVLKLSIFTHLVICGQTFVRLHRLQDSVFHAFGLQNNDTNANVGTQTDSAYSRASFAACAVGWVHGAGFCALMHGNHTKIIGNSMDMQFLDYGKRSPVESTATSENWMDNLARASAIFAIAIGAGGVAFVAYQQSLIREPDEDSKMSSSAAVVGDSPTRHSVGHIIEQLGFTRYHYNVVALVWLIYAMSGWVATLGPYTLDSAHAKEGDWIRQHGSNQRLTVHDISMINLFAGVTGLVSNGLLGYTSDMIGRMPVVTFCVCGIVVTSISLAFAPTKLIIAICLVLTPFSRDGLTTITNCVQAEWLPARCRSVFLVLPHAVWNVGRVAVTVLWLLASPADDWTTFFLLGALLPVAVSMFLIFRGQNYESPRFLASNGSLEACAEALRRAATSSDVVLEPGWDDPAKLRLQDSEGRPIEAKRLSAWEHVAELHHPALLHPMMLFSVMQISLCFASAGLFLWMLPLLESMGASDAGGSCMIAAPMGKITSNLLLVAGGSHASIINTWHKTPLLAASYFASSVFAVGLVVSTDTLFLGTCVFYYNFFEEIIWTVGQVYVTELFPTSIRSFASGIVYMTGHIGSILAGCLIGHMMEYWAYCPIVAMGCVLMLGCCLALCLPADSLCKELADRPD